MWHVCLCVSFCYHICGHVWPFLTQPPVGIPAQGVPRQVERCEATARTGLIAVGRCFGSLMVFWCLCHPVSIDAPTQWQCWCNYPLWQIRLGCYARYKAKSGTCTRSNCSSEEIDSFGGLFKLTLYPHRFICKKSKTYNDILALQTQHWSLFIQHSQLDTAASALQAAISRTWSRWGKRFAWKFAFGWIDF